ncbi:hypothetical protein C7475_101512 [Chitinophaga sp. S165]|nr:hypothetical protein C7475_101512 [Chitinophaga sp. S165]
MQRGGLLIEATSLLYCNVTLITELRYITKNRTNRSLHSPIIYDTNVLRNALTSWWFLR